MSLRKMHIERIAKQVVELLLSKHLLIESEEAVEGRVAAILSNNMETEREIDLAAHKLLDANRRAIGDAIDEQKAFTMIKKELAKKKGFIL